jgi:hypothetical protein
MSAPNTPGTEAYTVFQPPLDGAFFPDMPPKYDHGEKLSISIIGDRRLAKEAIECFSLLRIHHLTSPDGRSAGEEETDPGREQVDSVENAHPDKTSSPQKERLVLHSEPANAFHKGDKDIALKELEQETDPLKPQIARAKYYGDDPGKVIAEGRPYPNEMTRRAWVIWAELLTRIEEDIVRLTQTDGQPDLSQDTLFEFIREAGTHYSDIKPILHFVRNADIQGLPGRNIGEFLPLYLSEAVRSRNIQTVRAALHIAAFSEQVLPIEDIEYATSVIDHPNGNLLYQVEQRLDLLPPESPDDTHSQESSETDASVTSREESLDRLARIFRTSLFNVTTGEIPAAFIRLLNKFEQVYSRPSFFVPTVNTLIDTASIYSYFRETTGDDLRYLLDFAIAHGSTPQIHIAVENIFSKIDRIERREWDIRENACNYTDRLFSELSCMREGYDLDRQLAAIGWIYKRLDDRDYGDKLDLTNDLITRLLPHFAEHANFEAYRGYPGLARMILRQRTEETIPVGQYLEVFSPDPGTVQILSLDDPTLPNRLMEFEGEIENLREWRFAAVLSWLSDQSIDIESPEVILEQDPDIHEIESLYSRARIIPVGNISPNTRRFIESLTDRANRELQEYARQAYEDSLEVRAKSNTALMLMGQLAWDGRLSDDPLMKRLYHYFKSRNMIFRLEINEPHVCEVLREQLGIGANESRNDDGDTEEEGNEE